MCGIIGMAGDLSSVDATGVFRDLLDVGQLRGRDSTGAVRVHRSGDYSIAKEIGAPAYLCDTKRYAANIETGMSLALIGHCRAKTVGETSRSNAHPFNVPDAGIVGVHNGTLSGYYSWPEHKAGMTDSEALYNRIANHGDEETFSELEGAFACVWWDQNRHTLNFIRNSQRTLFFAFSEDRRKVLWASEPWMLSIYTRKAQGKLWADSKGQWYWPLEEMQLVRMSLNPGVIGPKGKVITYSEVKPIEHKPKRSVVTTPFRSHYNYNGQQDGWVKNDAGHWVRETTVDNDKGGDSLDDTIPFVMGGTTPTNKGSTESSPAGKESPQEAGASTDTGKELRTSRLILPTTRPDGSVLSDQITYLQNPTGQKTPSDNTNENSSPKSSIIGKTKSKDSTTPTNIGITSKRNLLSLPPTNGRSILSESNVVPLSALNKRLTTRRLLDEGKYVSFRKVAGMYFVTDNRTGDEHVASQLIENAGQACSLCQVPIHRIKEIGAIINDKTIICVDCANENSNRHVIGVS